MYRDFLWYKIIYTTAKMLKFFSKRKKKKRKKARNMKTFVYDLIN